MEQNTTNTTLDATLVPVSEPSGSQVPGFATKDAWELAQRQAKALMTSSMVPKNYQGNIGDCIIALDMAYRMGASPLMVMQNLYVVQGRPGWSAQFLIATFNQCGRFNPIRYEFNAEKTECQAWTTERSTGERIDGPTITMAMAKAEGWSTKSGSKWVTMPDLMLRYRAAAFLIRTCAPEISMGLQTAEEIIDITPTHVAASPADATVRFTPRDMTNAIQEIRERVSTVSTILEKFPTLASEQVSELQRIEDTL